MVRRSRAQRSPQVIVSARRCNQVPLDAPRVRKSTNTVSQALLFRNRSLYANDVEIEPEHLDDDALVDELSMDELMAPAIRPALRKNVAKLSQLEDIDWFFWVAGEDNGSHWKSLSEFPRHTRARFVNKFNTDYLTKPAHFESYARLLRNRHKRLHSHRCVGNVTYANRNMPSTWNKTGPGMGNTCDTCSARGRFCARLVRTTSGIQLGFYPLPSSSRLGVNWTDLRYWVRDR
jgi:hypothetical protein